MDWTTGEPRCVTVLPDMVVNQRTVVVKGGVETDGVTAVGHLSPVPRETEVPRSYNGGSDVLGV